MMCKTLIQFRFNVESTHVGPTLFDEFIIMFVWYYFFLVSTILQPIGNLSWLLCLPSVHRGGDMLLYLCPLSAVCESVSVSVPFIWDQRFPLCRLSNTGRSPNAGLMLAHLLRRWANISPVLGQRLVFGATLNMGQCHRPRAYINPALVQRIVLVPPACWYRQHEVLTRTEWILASTGDAGPAFNRHWIGVGLYSRPAVSRPACYWTQNMRCWTSDVLMLVWCIEPALGRRFMFAGSHIVFRTSLRFKNGIINSA